MSARDFDPLRLDVRAFAQDAAHLEGRWPLHQFERIRDAIHSEVKDVDADEVAWRAHGEIRSSRGQPNQPWLHLLATARLKLECQRCLDSVDTALAIDRWFLFVSGEEAAAQTDADINEDVLALTRALNLRDLLEDELLLALPLVPRHEVCPAPLMRADDVAQASHDRLNPFAALTALKRGRPQN